MLGQVLDVLYPRRCAGCAVGPWPFCERCRRELVALAPPWCERCGSPAPTSVPICPNCPPDPVARCRGAFLFDGPARSAVHRLKFGGLRGVAEALGRAMATVAPTSAEAVTWVPLSRRRLAERGFDQARALAIVVGRELDLPVRRLLVRSDADAATQARRRGEERRTAMLGRFSSDGPSPRAVLLVDDVLTTGATAAACASALTAAGSIRVDLVVAARAVRATARGYTRSGFALGSVVARGTAPR